MREFYLLHFDVLRPLLPGLIQVVWLGNYVKAVDKIHISHRPLVRQEGEDMVIHSQA